MLFLFVLSCKPKCRNKLVPSERLALAAVCLDCRRQIDLEYVWEAFERTANGLKQLTNLKSHTATGVNAASLVINSNFFTAGQSYLVRLKASKPKGSSGIAERNFTAYLNRPPSSGRCGVEPNFGYARVTNFQVTCHGWQDPDSVTYRFSSNSSGHMALIYSGAKDSVRLMIPSAPKDANITVKVNVRIEDSYGLGVETNLYLLVGT